jgi:hypothetical protein
MIDEQCTEHNIEEYNSSEDGYYSIEYEIVTGQDLIIACSPGDDDDFDRTLGRGKYALSRDGYIAAIDKMIGKLRELKSMVE